MGVGGDEAHLALFWCSGEGRGYCAVASEWAVRGASVFAEGGGIEDERRESEDAAGSDAEEETVLEGVIWILAL